VPCHQMQARKKETSSEQGIVALRALAARGAWKRMGTLAGQLLAVSHPVDELLRLRMYRIIAMLKMREVPQAARELGLLGDLTGHGWFFERYPTMYPTKRGSMVPFTLLLLHALMPSYASDYAQSLQRMYDLLDLLRRGSWPALTVEASETASATDGGRVGSEQDAVAAEVAGAADADADADVQRRQRAAVALALVNVYCAAQEFPLAILHLEQMIAAESERAAAAHATLSLLHSLLGRTHIQVGNLQAAEDAFNKLECLLPDADDSADVRMNRGYLAMASGEYESALAELDAALAIDPRCAVAANNRAVCLLYCCRLADAIASLEAFLKHDPERNTQQALLSNLAVLYQMLSGGAAAKQTLEKLALTFGPDDLECSALLLNAV